MSYITNSPNYAIAIGDAEFESMQTSGNLNMITAVLSGIATADTTLELQQSVDNINWSLIPGSTITLPIATPHHTWNLTGLPKGAFVRVAVRKGTAIAGVVNSIKMLTND